MGTGPVPSTSTMELKLKVNNTPWEEDQLSLPTRQQNRSQPFRVGWIGSWDPSMSVRELGQEVSSSFLAFLEGREGKREGRACGKVEVARSEQRGRFSLGWNLSEEPTIYISRLTLVLGSFALDSQAPSSPTSKVGKVSFSLLSSLALLPLRRACMLLLPAD